VTVDGQARTSANIGSVVMQNCYAIDFGRRFYEGNGEGGIRTLGSLLGYGALAKRCFRPLSHLTKNRLQEYREEMSIANC
jgi:hypothetical protein